jgi:hypothetical protein
MKRYKSLASLALAAVLLTGASGCRDEFSELNQDPASVTEGNPGYLFAQAVLSFEPSDYTYWFYNANSMFQWVQTAVSTGGVTSSLTDGAPEPNFKFIDVLKYANELKYLRSTMSPEDAAKYENYAACLDVLCVYMGIFDSDMIGNIPYTEGANAAHGGTLTPKYDAVKDLYDLWLTSLDNDVKTLTTATGQEFDANQDPVYAGQTDKWAKLANSLKLKIATRLINVDRSRAFSIAQAVTTSPAGYIDGQSDDFLFNKCTYNSSSMDYAYHWENGILASIAGSKTMIDFLVDNRDPRVRFIYRKNRWNSKIVQAFFDAKRQNDVPKYIMANVDYNVNADGSYHFKAWKGAGEPWVRYYGMPLNFNAGQQASIYGDWFNYNLQCKLGDKTYFPCSDYQTEMIYGRVDFTLPTAPNDPAPQDLTDQPWWGMYMTTAETNLYLAEFSLLGASLPQAATDYYNKALRASVTEYDELAAKNKIPYYGTTYNYDPNEKVIDLQAGEIDTMMAHPDYQLTGDKASDLEKVYLQEIIHFSMQPIDLFATAERSGVPTFKSKIFPRMDYAANGIPANAIPRRMSLSAPSPTDLMYDVLKQAYADQGYTAGGGAILNSQRVWQDKQNPQWGAGPIL